MRMAAQHEITLGLDVGHPAGQGFALTHRGIRSRSPISTGSLQNPAALLAGVIMLSDYIGDRGAQLAVMSNNRSNPRPAGSHICGIHLLGTTDRHTGAGCKPLIYIPATVHIRRDTSRGIK